MVHRSILSLLAIALVSLSSVSARADVPKVVATIVPIHSLAASVMQGVGTPELLLPGGASPHAYSMKPSDARKLRQANVIFWVGPNIESFLTKPIKTLGRNAKVVELEDAKTVVRLPLREGGVWEGHDHDHHDDHGDHKGHGHKGHGHDHKGHDHGKKDAKHDDHDHKGHGHGKKDAKHDDHDEVDAHIWLDPRNAAAIVQIMADTLATADPANAARYRANAAATKRRLSALENTTRRRLAPVRNKRYIVFHDAYQYFEKRFGLAAAGSITISPERAPGPRRLYEIRKRILDGKVVCVFAEPQFQPRVVQTVIRGTSAKAGVLDPLGANLTPGPNAYFQLQNNLAASLVSCLGR